MTPYASNRTASFNLRLKKARDLGNVAIYEEKLLEKLVQTAADLSPTVARRGFWPQFRAPEYF